MVRRSLVACSIVGLWSVHCRCTRIGTRIVITGSTGIIGKAIARQLSQTDNIGLYIAGRDQDRLSSVLQELYYERSAPSVDAVICDFSSSVESLETLSLPELYSSRCRNAILINNAGVCLQGNGIDALKQSLLVNCLGPARLSEMFLVVMRDRLFLDANMISCTNNDDASYFEPLRGTIINVSSGEGELVFLNSRIKAELERIHSYADWRHYIKDLSSCRSFDPNNIEYAYGESPMYSVSKALLNVLTRVMQSEAPAGCRIISVCPGNVVSPMSTEEEILSAISAEQAAGDILTVALGDERLFPGGQFYRYCEPIPW